MYGWVDASKGYRQQWMVVLERVQVVQEKVQVVEERVHGWWSG